MAARPPREGLEFVPGTMEEVGVELLKHVKDPQDVIAYGGYGFWAPAAAISKVSGASKQELTNAPIAPRTAPSVDDTAYESREVDEYGQPVAPDPGADEVDLEANAPFPEPSDKGPKDDGIDDVARNRAEDEAEEPAAKKAAPKKSTTKDAE